MNFLNKLERKFGRYAIPHLTTYIIITYVIGYLLNYAFPSALGYMTLDPYMIIFHGQVWRLVSWLLIPPSSLDIFTVIMLFFYYSIGSSLERAWGDFRYNVYIFFRHHHDDYRSVSVVCIYRIFLFRNLWTELQHLLHQSFHFPWLCDEFPGYAGNAVFPDSDQDEVHGGCLCGNRGN